MPEGKTVARAERVAWAAAADGILTVARAVVRRPYALIALLIFPVAILYSRLVYAPCDDAYIYFVYARNFIEGHGLTYNGVHVEGYTSPLWMWTLAAAGLTGLPLPAIAETLSTLSGLAALIVTYALAKRITGTPRLALLAPVLLTASGDFALYMGSGLEQVLFAALVAAVVLVACYSAAAKTWTLPALMAAMILVRPEGVLIAAIVFAMRWRGATPLGVVVREAAVLAAMLLPFVILRYAVYGYLLPNTYYVKSGMGLVNLGQGVRYLLRARWRYGPVAALVAAAVLAQANRDRRVLTRLLPLGAVSAGWLAYVAMQGGDSLLGGRMIVPILPLGSVAIAALAGGIGRRPVARWSFAIGAALLLVLGYAGDAILHERTVGERRDATVRQAAGRYLRAHYPATTVVALNPAGIIAYYSGLPTIDMLGLNDPYIAHHGKRDVTKPFGHQIGDGEYVLTRKPGVILLSSIPSDRPGPYISDTEIWNSVEFRKVYQATEWPGIGWAYVRK